MKGPISVAHKRQTSFWRKIGESGDVNVHHFHRYFQHLIDNYSRDSFCIWRPGVITLMNSIWPWSIEIRPRPVNFLNGWKGLMKDDKTDIFESLLFIELTIMNQNRAKIGCISRKSSGNSSYHGINGMSYGSC